MQPSPQAVVDVAFGVVAREVTVGFEVFFAFEELVEQAITHHEKRHHEEGLIHFEQNVEAGVKRDGEHEAFGDFFRGKNSIAFEVENRMNEINNRIAFRAHLFGPNRISEVGDAVKVTVDTGEKNVCKGGENGTEYEGNKHHVEALIFPNVVEVEAVFDEGEAQCGDDGKFNRIVDVAEKTLVGFFDHQVLHVFFNHADEHEHHHFPEWQIECRGKTEQIGLQGVCVHIDVEARKILPAPFVEKNRGHGEHSQNESLFGFFA